MFKNIVNVNVAVDEYDKAVKLYDELGKKLENIADQDAFGGEVFNELLARFKEEDEFNYDLMMGDGRALVDAIRANEDYECIEEVQDDANEKFSTFCAYNEYEVKEDLMKQIIDSLSREDRSTMCEGLNTEDMVLGNVFWDKWNVFRYNNLFCSRDMASDIVENKVGCMVFYGERLSTGVINCLKRVNEDLVDYYYDRVECW